MQDGHAWGGRTWDWRARGGHACGGRGGMRRSVEGIGGRREELRSARQIQIALRVRGRAMELERGLLPSNNIDRTWSRTPM